MSVRLNHGKLIALGLIGAVLFALVLGATPQLHERLHQASSTANHVCAVTLLSSGNYQHTLGAAIALAPPAPPPSSPPTPPPFFSPPPPFIFFSRAPAAFRFRRPARKSQPRVPRAADPMRAERK